MKKATGAAHKMRAVAFVLAAAAPYQASALLDHGARRALRGRRLRGATFGLVTRTSPSDANAMYYPQQSYGKSVAIDGDIAVVGAPGDSNEKGAAYVLRTTDGGATYVELAKLTASDRYSVAGEHRFGWSVAIDGNTIVVGAPATVAWDSVDTPGAAYVYRTTDGWASHTEIKLTADDAEERDGFGGAVAIAGNTTWWGPGTKAAVRPTSTARPTAAARIPRWPSSPATASTCSTPPSPALGTPSARPWRSRSPATPS